MIQLRRIFNRFALPLAFILGSLPSVSWGQRSWTADQHRIGRSVDDKAFSLWTRTLHFGSDADFDHDGMSWREREAAYHFRVIGLNPNDFPYIHWVDVFPPVMKEPHPWFFGGVINGKYRNPVFEFDLNPVKSRAYSAEELHFQLAQAAKRYSSSEDMGPLACRMTAVLMIGGAELWGGGGNPEYVYRDLYPYPLDLCICLEYLDPKGAAEFIAQKEQEAKQKEQEVKK